MRHLVLLGLLALLPLRADDHWISVHAGPFQVFSSVGDKSARDVLNQLEQLRYALGAALAKQDLPLVRPIKVLVFRHGGAPAPLAGLALSRDAWMVAVDEKALLTIPLKGRVTRRLLDENTHKLPDAVDSGLVALYSTLSANGTRVTVGEPVANPTRDWARLQMLVTDENTAGELHIFLSNLEQGGDMDVACRNAFRFNAAELERRLTAYLGAGHFAARTFGGAAISPDRDFHVTQLDASDAKLLMADYLLAAGSPRAADLYLQVHGVEAAEGVGLAALANGDRAGAQKHLADAIAQNSKNARAWYEAGLLESAVEKKRADLVKAAELNPKWADPFVRLSETEPGPVRRTFWLKKAAEASSRDIALWEALARSAAEAEQFQDAARAWAMAERAAGSDDERQKVRDERLRAEQERLDAADAARKREEEERQRDLDRVRQASLAEIHAAESKANAKLNPNGQFSKEGAVEWSELEKSAPSVDGVFERFDCLGQQGRLVIHTAQGRVVRLLVTDPSQASIQGSDGALACGAQKPARKVHVSYDQKPNQKTGTSGEVRAIQFVQEP
ncbi:MAG: hypothetical protein ABSH47_19675 [Bryobacteraceae bacterium]